MAKPAKEIYTFTALLLKAAKLFKSDPAEYHKLTSEGSAKFIEGLRVYASGWQAGNGSIAYFAFMYKGKDLCQVRGSRHKGKFYTQYFLSFRVGTYSKTAARYLPITLTEGFKFQKWLPTVFHNADGSEARKAACGYLFRKRGWFGRTDTNDGGCVYLRDRDGKMIDRLIDCEERNSENDMEGITMEGCRCPVDVQAGFLPGSVGKEAWYQSMIAPEFEGKRLWDSATVRMTAARTHATALRMIKQHPHLKIALYPMLNYKGDLAGVRLASRFQSMFSRNRPTSHCLGRDANNEGEFYYLPQLLVYWTITSGKAELGSHYGDQIRFVQATIPPYGNNGLERMHPKELQSAETFRWGHEAKRCLPRGAVPERCFHTFDALKAGAEYSDFTRSRMFRKNEFPDPAVYWPEANGAVAVVDYSEDSHYSNREGSFPRECQPENILTGIAERELINSLPLC